MRNTDLKLGDVRLICLTSDRFKHTKHNITEGQIKRFVSEFYQAHKHSDVKIFYHPYRKRKYRVNLLLVEVIKHLQKFVDTGELE